MPKTTQPTDVMSYSTPPRQNRGMFTQRPGSDSGKDLGKFDQTLKGRGGSTGKTGTSRSY